MEKPLENKSIYLQCSCLSPAHLLHFTVDTGEWTESDWPPEAFVEFLLNPVCGFWGRIKNAILYIFNKKPRFGYFDCWIMKPEDAPGFIDILQEYIELHNEWVAENIGESDAH